jgi:SAM-dependent methyltransferase
MTFDSLFREAVNPERPSAKSSAPSAQQPAHIALIQMAAAIWGARAIYGAASLGLADLLAAGPRATSDLAHATGTHPPSLYRLLRALGSLGVLTEVEPRTFALTALGKALKTGAPGAARATVLTIAGHWQWKAWDEFLFSLQTGSPALGRVYGTGLFDYLATHQQDSANFNEAMVGIHGAVVPAVVDAYDFARFRTVVDIGGGTGTLLTAILRANEEVNGILFELPDTALLACDAVKVAGLSSRCSVIEGDFYKAVPSGHDAYVLSHVLHDWTDEQALPILRNCRQAMSAEGRLLVVEAVLPPGDQPHHGKLMDLLMLTVTGGVERTAEEFSALLAAAGFRMTRVFETSTHQSIVEALPV